MLRLNYNQQKSKQMKRLRMYDFIRRQICFDVQSLGNVTLIPYSGLDEYTNHDQFPVRHFTMHCKTIDETELHENHCKNHLQPYTFILAAEKDVIQLYTSITRRITVTWHISSRFFFLLSHTKIFSSCNQFILLCRFNIYQMGIRKIKTLFFQIAEWSSKQRLQYFRRTVNSKLFLPDNESENYQKSFFFDIILCTMKMCIFSFYFLSFYQF